jgi:predicted phage tail protein
VEDIKIIEADIEELFKLMPEARYKVTIIAQRRRIQELENALVQKSKDKLDIKKAKVS